MTFSLIPVLDVKEGRTVHAIAGDRAHYRPLVSNLVAGSQPIDVARAYRDRLGLRSIYLADLDAIAGKPGNVDLWRSLADEGFQVWLDSGIREQSQINQLEQVPEITIVVGLETIAGPGEARAILDRVGADRAVFSLDQFQGHPLVSAPGRWRANDVQAIAEQVVSIGYEWLLLLDLARVGTGQGPGPLELFRHLHRNRPLMKLCTGGGVSDIEEVRSLAAQGLAAVLVGSALHDSRISLEDLRAL